MIDLEDEQDRAINQQTNKILGTVAGWGWNDEDGVNMSSQLHRVQVPLMSRAECEKRFQTAGYSIPIDKTKLCAGWPEGGQDACQVLYQHFPSPSLLVEKTSQIVWKLFLFLLIIFSRS